MCIISLYQFDLNIMFTYVLNFNTFCISKIYFLSSSFSNLFLTGVDEEKFFYCSNIHQYFFTNHDITGNYLLRQNLMIGNISAHNAAHT